MSRTGQLERHLGVYLTEPTPREGFPGVRWVEQGSAEPLEGPPLEIFVVPHTHADLCWPDVPEACINACMACIGDLLRFQEEVPGFRFSMEHAFYLREFLARHPEAREPLVELMRQGIFECGAFYLGPTEVTAGGEALIRELYLGKRWLKEHLGVEANVVWNVDCPGHTQQLPQILARAGVPSLVIWKEFPVFEHDFSGYVGPCLFRWAAPDGSEVVTCFTPGGYGVGRLLGLRDSFESVLERLPGFIEDVAAHLQQYRLPGVVLVADGTDIERPTLQVPANIDRWNRRFAHPQIRLATAAEFFRAVERANLPASTGEAPNWWDTVGSFQLARVMADRRCEPRLAAAEAFSAVAATLNPAFEYPADDLERAWENRLFASEHNEGGRHGEISDALKLNKVRAARVLADNALNRALAEIAVHVDFRQEGIPLVVFNSLLWSRQDLVRSGCRFPKGQVWQVGLLDAAGQDVPIQVESVERYADGSLKALAILFVAGVPALGYATFYLVPGREPAGGAAAATALPGSGLENAWYRLVADPTTGGLTGLWDKSAGREIVDSSKFHLGELLALENLAHDEDEHLTGRFWRAPEYPARGWLAENGPVRAVWVAEGALRGGRRRQRLILYRDLDRLDLETELEWHGEPDLQIMQAFPLCHGPDARLTYEVPFGHAVFGQEHPHWTRIHPSVRGARNWVDLSDESGGVTLAGETIPYELRDRTPQPQAGFVIQPILLKTTYSCYDHLNFLLQARFIAGHRLVAGARDFDLRPEDPATRWSQPGHHQFRFSLRAHAGPLDPAEAARFGWEHQTPLLVFVHDAGQLDQFTHLDQQAVRARLDNAARSLPEQRGFLALEGEGVVPTWAKRAEDGQGLIVRCYEARGQATTARLQSAWPLAAAWRTDIIEYNQAPLAPEGASVAFSIEPHAIETVRLSFKSEAMP